MPSLMSFLFGHLRGPWCFSHSYDRHLLINFMGLIIVFWNCQGIRSKRKELDLYLKENVTDIIALNETFLSKKAQFQNSKL